MLDASNPGGHRPKKGMQSRPVDPFWTGSASVSSVGGAVKAESQENHGPNVRRSKHRNGDDVDEEEDGRVSDLESNDDSPGEEPVSRDEAR